MYDDLCGYISILNSALFDLVLLMFMDRDFDVGITSESDMVCDTESVDEVIVERKVVWF